MKTGKNLEKQFMLEIKNQKSILIYGMGMVGKLLYARLCSYKLEDHVIGFMVSQKTQNIYLDIPVYEAGEMVLEQDEISVIVATLPIWHNDILQNLSTYNFAHVIIITEELHQDLSINYMQEFRKQHIFQKKAIDILFMASDNNFSSGAFLCLIDLNIELKKMGFSLAVILPEYGNGEELLIQNGIDYTYIPSRHWLMEPDESISTKDLEAENSQAIKEIEELIEQCQVKLVHNNTIYTYVGAVAAYNKKIPYVWHIRENIEDQGFAFCDYPQTVKWINGSERIFAVSQFMASCYQGLEPKKICICYDGIDVAYYYAKHNELFKRKEVMIIQIGAIAPVKNQEELIKAICKLKNKQIHLRVQFIGSGEKKYIEKLHRLIEEYQLENEIVFCGNQHHILNFYQNADIVISCSKSESFGRVTVEAQLSGCLVIGSNTGATPELVQDKETGFLYQQGDPGDLARKIEMAISDPDTSNRIALNGQMQAYARYSRKFCAERIKKQYNEILKDRQG